MELSIKERIQLSMILPREGNLVEMMLIKEMSDKFRLTPTEIDECGVTIDKENLFWIKDKIVDISLTKSEIKILKDSVKKMDEEKKISIENIDLYIRINNL